MKKVILRSAILLAALIAVFVLVAPPAEKAQAAKGASQFCTEVLEPELSGCFKNHGECVSIVQAVINAQQGHGNTDGVAICKLIQNGFTGSECIGEQDFPLGECVSFFAHDGCL